MKHLVLAGLMLLSSTAYAQVRPALPAQLAPATRDTLERLIDSARAVGLPGEPLAAKAAEGALKGADDTRIVRVVRSLVRELGEARQSLPRDASVSSLTAAASALHAGATAATLRRVVAAGKDDTALNVALVTLTDLVANGVSSDAAASSIEQLMRRGARAPEMLAFRSAVASNIQRGETPERAIQRAMP